MILWTFSLTAFLILFVSNVYFVNPYENTLQEIIRERKQVKPTKEDVMSYLSAYNSPQYLRKFLEVYSVHLCYFSIHDKETYRSILEKIRTKSKPHSGLPLECSFEEIKKLEAISEEVLNINVNIKVNTENLKDVLQTTLKVQTENLDLFDGIWNAIYQRNNARSNLFHANEKFFSSGESSYKEIVNEMIKTSIDFYTKDQSLHETFKNLCGHADTFENNYDSEKIKVCLLGIWENLQELEKIYSS